MRTRDFVLITAHVAMLAFLFGCLMHWPAGTALPLSGPIVRVRLVNHTSSDFQRVLVGRRDYGALPREAVSRYWSFAGGYPGNVEAFAADKTIRTYEPIDDMGGGELPPNGSYTYVLSESAGSLDIHYQPD